VFSLLGVAALYILAGADFVGVTQLIVYIGGILVLLMFGLMLTNKLNGQAVTTRTHNRVWGYGLALGLLAMLFGALAYVNQPSWILNAVPLPIEESTIRPIGRLMLTHYVLAFELAGILLLLALVGAAWLVRPAVGPGTEPENLA
jgi:NADH-quinone oxidoreductase subunit J